METFYIFNDTNYSELIILYSIVSALLFNLQRWINNYQGADEKFKNTLIKFMFISS